uniref:Sphingomyelin phosphodiesterase C-terminal domain-containing protein n=1 Tax=Stomoxys calcitrans TaxID=35570 RepID=A0A1I8NMJ2_STOCA
MMMSPSVTPRKMSVGSNNPAMRLYKFDTDSGQVLDYTQYYMDLQTANTLGEPNWVPEYNLTHYYALSDISAISLHNFVDRFTSNDGSWFAKYYRANSVRYPTDPCENVCMLNHYCAITRVDYKEFRQCLEKEQSALRSKASHVKHINIKLLVLLAFLPCLTVAYLQGIFETMLALARMIIRCQQECQLHMNGRKIAYGFNVNIIEIPVMLKTPSNTTQNANPTICKADDNCNNYTNRGNIQVAGRVNFEHSCMQQKPMSAIRGHYRTNSRQAACTRIKHGPNNEFNLPNVPLHKGGKQPSRYVVIAKIAFISRHVVDAHDYRLVNPRQTTGSKENIMKTIAVKGSHPWWHTSRRQQEEKLNWPGLEEAEQAPLTSRWRLPQHHHLSSHVMYF